MLNLNQFRTKEFLDSDNKYNRQVINNIVKKLNELKGEQQAVEVATPTGEISASDKLTLNRLINSFKNELDSQIQLYYSPSNFPTNANDLLIKWNNLVIFYNTNINSAFKSYLDSQIQTTDIQDKMNIMVDIATEYTYYDKLDIIKLQGFIRMGKYEVIQHAVFSAPTPNKWLPREPLYKKEGEYKKGQYTEIKNEYERNVYKEIRKKSPKLPIADAKKLAEDEAKQKIVDIKQAFANAKTPADKFKIKVEIYKGAKSKGYSQKILDVLQPKSYTVEDILGHYTPYELSQAERKGILPSQKELTGSGFSLTDLLPLAFLL
jgi:hypothetical protein